MAHRSPPKFQYLTSFNAQPIAHLALMLFAAAGLTACGSSGSAAEDASNTAPTTTSVTIDDDNGGLVLVGDNLTGSYVYADANGDSEGASTFRWLRGGAAIGGITATTYTLVLADVGQTITFEVTPVAASGATTGTRSTSGGLAVNAVPTATDVTIADNNGGIPLIGDSLVGSYIYTDVDDDSEGTSSYRWLRNGAAIDGATSITYVLVADDSDQTISFEVTPVAASGTTTGAGATSGGLIVGNSAPIATNVAIADNNGGFPLAGDSLIGSYIYIDMEGDSEGASSYRWLRNDATIGGMTSMTYTLVTADVDQTISFEVTPAAATGTTTGEAVVSLGVAVTLLDPPMLSLDVGIKQLQFNWPAVDNATHYKLMENPDGASGFTQVGTDIATTSTTLAITVYHQDWAHARYSLQACNTQGCSDSSNEVSTLGEVLSAVGYIKASNTGAGNLFGSSISLSSDGYTLAVGAQWEDSNATGISTDGSGEGNDSARWAGAVYVFSRSSGAWAQQAYVKASNTEEFDWFGRSVSLSADGDTLAVGASEEDSNATGISTDGSGEDNNSALATGAVYVFSRSGSTWTQQAYVKASNTGELDRFGESVSLSGDGNTLAVGARGEASNATGVSTNGTGEGDNSASIAGAVYVFSRSSGTWAQQAYMKASNTEAGDWFGESVSLSGDGYTLAVGALGEDSNATGVSTDGSGESDNSAGDAGAVYVFNRSGGAWTQQAYVKASNTGGGDWFGESVSLSSDDGNTLAVGAWREDSNATGVSTDGSGEGDNSADKAGAVYVFSRSISTWTQQAYVKAANTDADDRFGRSVSLGGNGNTLAVGAISEGSNASGISTDGSGEGDNSVLDAGAVYVFSRSGSTWTQQAYVKASNTGANDGFGRPVSLGGNGNTLAVGAYFEDSNATGVTHGTSNAGADNSAIRAGAVYLY